VKQGDAVVIVESMKMEISVPAPCNGRVIHIFCQEGGQVAAGQNLFVIQTEG
jgi:urea carboxylase